MFIAYEVSLEVIRLLRPVLPLIQRHDPDLADQLRRASNAVPLHIAEGRVDEPVVAAARACIDRLLGLLYPLTR